MEICDDTFERVDVRLGNAKSEAVQLSDHKDLEERRE